MNSYLDKYSSASDIELQSLVKGGDEHAFREIYDRYWDKVFVICNNRLHQTEAAQDIVQDIFLSLWEHPDLTKVQNMEAYLFQACKFSVIKYVHKSSRYDSIDSQMVGLLDRVVEMSIDEALHIKFLQDIIFQEVERLPKKTAIIFNYSRKEHLSSKEIADKLNISPRTVENQISHALKELRIFLKNLKTFMIF